MSDADVEFARVKARRRMIGMAVLVLAGVVGFPWLFETQPRPLASDVQVVSANAASGTPALVVPAPRVPVTGRVETAPVEPEPVETVVESAPEATASSATTTVAAALSSSAVSVSGPKPPSAADAASKAAAAKAQAAAKARSEAKAKAEAKAQQDAKAKAKAEDKAREDKIREDKAKALAKTKAEEKARDDKARLDAKPDSDTRYIVQVGAFSDANTAQAARAKVEKLGIKTYTQEVSTPAGKKIRVRVGPYANKAEADKAMATLKKAGLLAAVLTL